MSDTIRAAWIVAAALVIAGLMSGGRYAVSGAGQGNAIVVDRLTGSAWNCWSRECTPVTYK